MKLPRSDASLGLRFRCKGEFQKSRRYEKLHIAVSCSAVEAFLLLLLGKLTKEVVHSLRMMLQEVEVVSFYV